MKYLQRYTVLLAMLVCSCTVVPDHAPDAYWNLWTIDASGSGADGVHTGDINRDGLVDVVS